MDQYRQILTHYEQTSLFLETLLRRSHFEEGRYVLEKRACNFKKQVIDLQLERYRPRFEERGIEVDTSMKLGAFDYYVKTDEEDRIIGGVLRAIRMIELRDENRAVKSRLVAGGPAHPEAFADIVTRSRAMLSVFSYIEAVAGSSQPLLITGESGVGKENLVRAAHGAGPPDRDGHRLGGFGQSDPHYRRHMAFHAPSK